MKTNTPRTRHSLPLILEILAAIFLLALPSHHATASTTYYTDWETLPSGATIAGPGDSFIVSGYVLNDSTRHDYNLSQSLIALSGSSGTTHPFTWPGGGGIAANNFTIGTLEVQSGNSAIITQSGSNGGVGIYVGTLQPDSSATVQMQAHTGGATNVTPLVISVLKTSGSSTVIDLTNNAMMMQASGTAAQTANLAAVRVQILRGYNGGTWTGTGITSSTAAADAQVNGVLAVMVYDNTQIGLASFEGVSGLAATGFNQVLLKTTYTGDFDANGTLNSLDYGLEDYYASFNSTLGDLNGDGVVNSLDYGQLDYVSSNQAYGTLSAGSSGGIIPAAVPEPGSIGLMLVGAVGMAVWNRRTRRRC